VRRLGLGIALLAGPAFALDWGSPIFEAPSTRAIGPATMIPPKPGDPAGDAAYGAYQQGYFLTALKEAEKRLADNPRDGAAMTLIGEIYHEGLAVKRDDAQAASWWRLAAAAGDIQGAYEYGVALVGGAGVKIDGEAARQAFLKAAAKEHPGALYNLGVLALQGVPGGKPDYNAAVAYFARAAAVGDGNSAYSLGVLTRQGKGAPLDIEKAAMWLKQAADEGIIAGQVEYAIMLFNGVGVVKDEAGAAKLFALAAARRNPIAQNRLAHLYLTGRGVKGDIVRAALWHSLAKAAGLKDEALDKAIGTLSPEQIEQVNALARQQAEF